jgi:hypothetical protein
VNASRSAADNRMKLLNAEGAEETQRAAEVQILDIADNTVHPITFSVASFFSTLIALLCDPLRLSAISAFCPSVLRFFNAEDAEGTRRAAEVKIL